MLKSQIIYTIHQLQELFITLQNNFNEFAFDTETNGLSHDRVMIGFSVCVLHDSEYLSYYVPVRHTSANTLFAVTPRNVSLDLAVGLLSELFASSKHVCWIHNAKFDLKVLRNEGISEINCDVRDTQCISWLLNPERQGGHGLKSLVKQQLNYEMGTFTQFSGYERNSDVPVGTMGAYAMDDAKYLLMLAHKMYPKLNKQLLKVFHDLEMPMMRIVEEMEHFGMKVNVNKISQAGISMKEKVKEAENRFTQLFGFGANIASSQYLQVMFDLDGQKHWPRIDTKPSKSGQHSTGKDTLLKIKDDPRTTDVGREAVELVLTHRKYSKLVSTYTESLIKHADTNHRIHGSFNQWGTATGRMSSSSPNLQNIPSSPTAEGDLLRKSFIAEDGYTLIVADYSQIELRVAGHLSRDKVMTEIYNNDGDIHQMTADACGCVRFDAKAINFGLIYKMGAKTLSGRINKTEEEAQEYSDKYFEKYSGIRHWQEALVARCRRLGYTETIIGRRRPLPDINSKQFGKKNSAERVAINTAVQGSAADIMKIGMRNFIRFRDAEGYTSNDFRIIGQVHDEVIVEAKKELGGIAMQALKDAMENAVKLTIKLVAEPELAGTWGEAK